MWQDPRLRSGGRQELLQAALRPLPQFLAAQIANNLPRSRLPRSSPANSSYLQGPQQEQSETGCWSACRRHSHDLR